MRLPSLQAGLIRPAWPKRKSVCSLPPFGLFPIPVDQKPSVYPLEILDKNGAVLQRLSITVHSSSLSRAKHHPQKGTGGVEAVAPVKPKRPPPSAIRLQHALLERTAAAARQRLYDFPLRRKAAS